MSLEDIFNKFDPPKDYVSKMKDFDVKNIEPEYQKIIEDYRTPSKNYISPSARGLNYKDVSPSILDYVINTCAGCSEIEKYHASLVAIYKAYEISGSYAATEVKDHILTNFSEPAIKQPSLAYLDQYNDKDKDIFYLIQIQIGNNTILKYGITDKEPRKRFATLRSNIKDKYQKQAVRIDPIAIIQCISSSAVEEEVKLLMLEHDFKKTNYYFEGHTETLSVKQLGHFKKLILEPLAQKFKLEITFIEHSKTIQGSLSKLNKPVINFTQEKAECSANHEKNDFEDVEKVLQQAKERDRQYMKSIHGEDWEPEQSEKKILSPKEQEREDAYRKQVDELL